MGRTRECNYSIAVKKQQQQQPRILSTANRFLDRRRNASVTIEKQQRFGLLETVVDGMG